MSGEALKRRKVKERKEVKMTLLVILGSLIEQKKQASKHETQGRK